MKIARSPLMLTLALTLAFGTLSVRSAGAHEGHDHEAMKKQEKKIDEALSALPSADQKLATAQRFCPIMTYDRLGSMGTPIKLTIEIVEE